MAIRQANPASQSHEDSFANQVVIVYPNGSEAYWHAVRSDWI